MSVYIGTGGSGAPDAPPFEGQFQTVHGGVFVPSRSSTAVWICTVMVQNSAKTDIKTTSQFIDTFHGDADNYLIDESIFLNMKRLYLMKGQGASAAAEAADKAKARRTFRLEKSKDARAAAVRKLAERAKLEPEVSIHMTARGRTVSIFARDGTYWLLTKAASGTENIDSIPSVETLVRKFGDYFPVDKYATAAFEANSGGRGLHLVFSELFRAMNDEVE